MLPLRPPVGKPAPLACTYAATGHNSAVLSLDVTEDLMVTGSKGLFFLLIYFTFMPSDRFCFRKICFCCEGALSNELFAGEC